MRDSKRRTSTRQVMTLALGLALIATAACERSPELDTRTFEMQHADAREAAPLVDPYVYGDREGAPGTYNLTEDAITVRELPENLDRIAEVLERFDRARPTVRLDFQIIEADGYSGSDPEIAEVEQELRKLFRFQGYRLAAEASVQVLEGGGIRQSAGNTNAEGYLIEADIRDVKQRGGGGSITMEVQLRNAWGPQFGTTVSVPIGETVVLGSGAGGEPGGPAAILVVTSRLVED